MKSQLLSIAILSAGLCGCMSAPDRVDVGWSHDSYPALGWPFGPRNEEDSLNTVGMRAAWHRDRYYMEMGLGAKLGDGGFYGHGAIFSSRMGIYLWER